MPMSWPEIKYFQEENSGGSPFGWKIQEVALKATGLENRGDRQYLEPLSCSEGPFASAFLNYRCYLWPSAPVFTNELLIP